MSGIWSFAFPTGLVLYWATSNTLRIAQQAYITRAFYGADDGDATIVDTTSDSPDNTPAKGTAALEGGSANGSGPNGSGSGGAYRNGRSPRTSSGRQRPASRGAGAVDGANSGSPNSGSPNSDGANGDSADSDSRDGKMGSADREALWAQRRRDKARVQAVKNRTEQSSRVTPKGTKPTDSKRKRKR
jgi:hypothetical protein